MRFVADGSLLSLISWWASLFLLGWLAWPITQSLLPNWPDRGYFSSKAVGLLLASWIAWFGASLGVINFSGMGPVAGVVLLFFLFLKLKPQHVALPLKSVIWYELGFIGFLLLGLAIRLSQPDIYGLEKFMDFAFMNAALRADSMPPVDPWFNGSTINYYYFGHAMAAWLTRLARVKADYGYNLMMATLFALFTSQVFAVVWAACVGTGRRTSIILAILAALCASIGTNLHTILYGVFRPWITSFTGRPEFYYPDSTRFIGFDPPTDDKLITEMAAYGFAVGDMHAHVLNLPCVMLIIGLLIALWQRVEGDHNSEIRFPWSIILALGACFGLSVMTNAWDVLIYGVVMLAFAIGLLSFSKVHTRSLIWEICIKGLAMIAVAAFIASPFLANFMLIGNGLYWASQHSPPWQILLLVGQALPLAGVSIVLMVMSSSSWGLKMAGVMALAALALQLVPEIIFLKDIYGADFARANTAFKISFETHILLTICAFVITAELLKRWQFGFKSTLPFLLLLPVLATLIYPKFWFFDRWANRDLSQLSLDGFGFFAREAPDDAGLLPFLQNLELGKGQSILEASGDSYTMAARFSALTGLPTAVGWEVHEWLWRNDATKVFARADQVKGLYEASSDQLFCIALKTLSPRFIIVGKKEVERYPRLQHDRFDRLLLRKQTSGSTVLYEVVPRACSKG